MKCDHATLLLSARADGDFVADQGLDQHLEQCAACQSFVTTTMRIRRSVRLTQVDGAVDVTDAVLTTLQDRQPTTERRPSSRLLVAAAVLIAVVGAAGFALGRTTTNTSIDATAVADMPVAATETQSSDNEDATVNTSLRNQGDLIAIWNQDALDPTIEPFIEANNIGFTTVRRNTIGLTGSKDADGQPVDIIDDGWTIPLDAIAIDPSNYGPINELANFPVLAFGETVLSETSADLRGLGIGATLDVGGATLTVVSIVPDEAVGAAEIVVNYDTGETIGITTNRYLLARTTLDPADYTDLLPEGIAAPVRIHDQTSTRWLRNSDAVLPQLIVKTLFGEFATRPAGEGFEVDPAWADTYLETIDLPGLGVVTCHRLITPIVQRAIEAAATDSVKTDGCWNPRTVRATGDLSRHTWGIAIDLEIVDPTVVDLLESEGLKSGANWLVPDPEHYEYTSAESPKPPG